MMHKPVSGFTLNGMFVLKVSRQILLFLLLACFSGQLLCQTLEPRRWSHLPGGVNFIGLGTAYTLGDINSDPANTVAINSRQGLNISFAVGRTNTASTPT
jgi:hypothetical protein